MTKTTIRLPSMVITTLAALVLSVPAIADSAQRAGAAVQEQEQQRLPLSIKLQRQFDRELPRRGEARSSVRNRFGDPEAEQGPVGEPPITTWQYPRFKVVFEHDWVIHTVVDPDSLVINPGNREDSAR